MPKLVVDVGSKQRRVEIVVASDRLTEATASMFIRQKPQHPRKDAAGALFAAAAAVSLLLVALLEQCRQALGSAVNLNEPVVL
ncbi:hypothetical protein [Nocardioides rubriscoriae]|uniref:hypothetical protein n=1 Tax=Nocardioides rubriscoriae TaxID=642762 RepID=UPI0011DF1AB8|nr:hypothetical protein [Nocardioides rubriscoriae]